MKFLDLTDKVFGRLTVIEKDYSNQKRIRWLCKCNCGATKSIASSQLVAKKTTSCGCYRREVSAARTGKLNIGKIPHNKMPDGIAAYRAIFSHYKKAAKRATRTLYFRLTFDQFVELTKRNCHYCGLHPSMSKRTSVNEPFIWYSGVDRKDSNLGYDTENCVPCCKRCNRAKWDMSISEFESYISDLINFNRLKRNCAG